MNRHRTLAALPLLLAALGLFAAEPPEPAGKSPQPAKTEKPEKPAAKPAEKKDPAGQEKQTAAAEKRSPPAKEQQAPAAPPQNLAGGRTYRDGELAGSALRFSVGDTGGGEGGAAGGGIPEPTALATFLGDRELTASAVGAAAGTALSNTPGGALAGAYAGYVFGRHDPDNPGDGRSDPQAYVNDNNQMGSAVGAVAGQLAGGGPAGAAVGSFIGYALTRNTCPEEPKPDPRDRTRPPADGPATATGFDARGEPTRHCGWVDFSTRRVVLHSEHAFAVSSRRRSTGYYYDE